MIGQRFGKWVVIKHDSTANGHKKYICSCDCGNQSIVYGNNLKLGKSSQCQECSRGIIFKKSMMGQKFGKWMVIGGTEKKDGQRQLKYLCRCECGNKSIVAGQALKIGRSKSCKDCANLMRGKNIQSTPIRFTALEMIGKRFDDWIVLERLKEKSSNNEILFLCQCKCGKKSPVRGDLLRKGKSKKCGTCSSRININKIHNKLCEICSCYGHKNINLETSECDHLGVCPRCDKFNMKDWLAKLATC